MNNIFYLSTGFILGYSAREYSDTIKHYSKPYVFKMYKQYVITSEMYNKLKEQLKGQINEHIYSKYIVHNEEIANNHSPTVIVKTRQLDNLPETFVNDNYSMIGDLLEKSEFTTYLFKRNDKFEYTINDNIVSQLIDKSQPDDLLLSATLVHKSGDTIDITNKMNSFLSNDAIILYLEHVRGIYNNVFDPRDDCYSRWNDYHIEYINKDDLTLKKLENGYLCADVNNKLIHVDLDNCH